MATVESVKAKLQGLIDRSNGVTGENHENLSDAVDALAAGYGQGGSDDGVLMSVLDGSVTEIVIPDGVGTLRDYALNKCTSLVKVVFPQEGFQNTGNYTFMGCTALAEINLPETLLRISNQAFRNCTALQSVTIPAAVTRIDNYAFQGCTGLKLVRFLGKPDSIGYAFMNSDNITDIYVPWSEGEVANAPWSATNATVHYNYTGEEA